MHRKIIPHLYFSFIPCQENNYRPKFLESRILIWILVVLIISKLFIISLFVYFPQTTFFADLLAALTKSTLIEMTNQERQSLGLNSLKVNQKLETAAYLKAQDMMKKDYFAHQSPEGLQPWYWLEVANYNYQQAGENLAIGFLDSEEVIKAWNESPSHKANLINPNYQEIGIAVLRGDFQGSDTTLVVQFLGSLHTKKTAAPKITEKPESEITEKEEAILPGAEPSLAEETEVLPEKEEPEKIAEETEAVEGEEFQIKSIQSENQEDGLAFFLFQFIARDYPDLLQKITFYFLLLVIILLLLTISIKFDVQDKGLLFRTMILIFFLILLIVFDKEIIIQLIPHNLII